MKTYDEIKQLLTEVVASEPDAVRDCMYVRGGEPHCIVGVVLSRLGVSDDQLSSFGGKSVHTLEEQGRLPGIDGRSVQLLSYIQMCQDDGVKWGNALRMAIKEIEDD